MNYTAHEDKEFSTGIKLGMSERQAPDDNNNTVILELSRFDLREVHTKKKARHSNKPHQFNNATLDEYLSIL
jgi:hypothetical protein